MRALLVLMMALPLVFGQLSYYNITMPFLVPESMDYVSGTGFILGSLGFGGSFKVNYNTGVLAAFFHQGINMNHTAGVQYDTRGGRNRVLLCAMALLPQPGPGGAAGGVISVDISSGTPTLAAFYDTSAVGSNPVKFCNDIIATDDGTIYATDSFGSQVWKISSAGVASQFIHDSRWDITNNFGLDGIELTRQGNLIVSHISHSELWLVTTTAPITATQIVVAGGYANSAPDGIYFGPHGCLYTVGNNKVYRLTSTNGWLNATVLESVTVSCLGPTAIAWNADAGAYYVSCAHLFDSGPYAIEKITFSVAESDALCNQSSAVSTGVTSVVLLMLVIAMSLAL